MIYHYYYYYLLACEQADVLQMMLQRDLKGSNSCKYLLATAKGAASLVLLAASHREV